MKKIALAALMVTAAVVIVGVGFTYAQQTKAQDSSDHHAGMNSRGDQAMGFSHEKTTHHFRLYKDGGAIEVAANDPKDTESRDMIRMHLTHIAKMFAAGDFDIPMFVHDTTPPGAAIMKEMREQIRYSYRDMEGGGRVRILTTDAKALEAVHSFLRFQIEEHQTGDSVEVSASEVEWAGRWPALFHNAAH